MSDLQGKFCIADTPRLGSRLIARKHGWTTTDVGLKNLTKDTDGVVVLMSPKVPPAPLKFKVCGKVESAADKSPVPGATLQIQGSHLLAVSDQKGKFCIKDMPKGVSTLIGTKKGYEDTTTKLPAITKDTNSILVVMAKK